jgi:23S rRNA (guanosine2251-2'-O)-methyltransferase
MNIPKDQIIIGTHAIHELLLHAPKRIVRLYTTSSKRSPVLDLAAQKKIPISMLSEQALTKMADSDSHQCLLAQIQPRNYLSVSDFLDNAPTPSFVLMLDQIFDPQNFGAILRSAECFGVSAVLWSKNRGADLTPVAAKTACGASELVPLIRVSNLATALDEFRKADYEIVATLLDATAEPATTFRYASHTVLILGSEGEGIQPLLRKKADRALYLPMHGKIQSLNVAQTAAALLALKECMK